MTENTIKTTERYYILEEGDDWIHYPAEAGIPQEVRDADHNRELAFLGTRKDIPDSPMRGLPAVWYIDEDEDQKTIRVWPKPGKCTKIRVLWNS
jgi:hypothetical protein